MGGGWYRSVGRWCREEVGVRVLGGKVGGILDLGVVRRNGLLEKVLGFLGVWFVLGVELVGI